MSQDAPRLKNTRLVPRIAAMLFCALCCLSVAAGARAREPSGQPALPGFFRPGEVKARFAAWEKRARKFEAALAGAYDDAAFAAVTARLRLIATDMERERDELTRRYEASLDQGRRRMTESQAKARAGMELGYDADALRYVDNVTAYAKALLGKLEVRRAAAASAPRPAGPPGSPPGGYSSSMPTEATSQP